MKPYRILLFFTALLLSFVLACRDKACGITDAGGGDCSIVIYPGEEEGTVSPMMMGFNTIYCYSPDAVWKRGVGPVPRQLRALGTRVLRYPAGTVTTYYHWQHPTGQGWKDSWDPAFDASKNEPSSAYMDIDEYLDVCRALKTEPLIGVNMGSGMRYHRVEESIAEAQALMRHCLGKGVKVKYFYLDNEPYQKDANYTYTAAEYAAMVNRYVPAMKKVDSGIRIIVNSKSFWKKPSEADLSYTKTLISKAGKNIDYIDIHNYWAWGHATYAHWQSQVNMQVGATGMTYREQRPFYRELAASLGYPDIDMISLEWNTGPSGKGNKAPSEAETALIVAEQFTQLIQSGMQMATFWPVYWQKQVSWSSRALLNARQDYRPNKVYGMFKLFKDILGQRRIKSVSSEEALQSLSVKSLSGDTVWVYLINKKAGQPADIHINIKNYLVDHYKASGFRADEESDGPLKVKELEASAGEKGLTLLMPAYSFAKVILTRRH